MTKQQKQLASMIGIGIAVVALLLIAVWVGIHPNVADNGLAGANHPVNSQTPVNSETPPPSNNPVEPGATQLLEFVVEYRGVAVPSAATLFVRSLGVNATVPVRLARKPGVESLIGRAELQPGDFSLALGEDLALDQSALHVSQSGFRTTATAAWTSFSTPLVLVASSGYSLRIETLAEDGVAVEGSLRVVGFPDPGTIRRQVATTGTAMLYQVPLSPVSIDFEPKDTAFESASIQFDPPADSAGRAVALRINVLRKLSLTVRFLDTAARHPPGTLFILQVTQLDSVSEGGRPKARALSLTDGATLPQDAVAKPGAYRFEWIRNGAAGPMVQYTRAELGLVKELVVLAPSPDAATVAVVTVDTTGKPLPGVALELTYQGSGWQKVTLTTDEEGKVRVPQWDRKAFSLVVRPPKGVECTPALLMNPVDGAKFVIRVHSAVSRLAVTFDGDIGPLRRLSLSLRLWAPPDASQRDWEDVVRYNDGLPTAAISTVEVKVSDALTNWTFEDPARLWVVAEIRGIHIGQWKLPDFLGFSEANPIAIRVAAGQLAKTASVALAGLDGSWLVAPGRKSVASMLCVVLRKNHDPDLLRAHGMWEASGNAAARVMCPSECPVFTALGADGTLVILRATWTEGTATLVADQTFAGGALVIGSPSASAPRLVVTGSYFQHGERTMYWDEFAADFEAASLPLTVNVPAGAPILVLPLTKDFGPATEPLDLSQHIYRADAGRQKDVRLP